MSASTIYWIIIGICIFEYILDAVLDYLNVRASKLPIPDLLKDLYDEDEVGRAAGADGAVFIINMLVFIMLWTPVSLGTGIFGNIVSRRNERQADAFACRYGLGESLPSALKKLSAASLSNLTPHPAVVFMSYSHPTLYERVKACTQYKSKEL